MISSAGFSSIMKLLFSKVLIKLIKVDNDFLIKTEKINILSQGQRDRRQRALLQHQHSDFLFHMGWSGCFTQSKQNIMKVVQS